jgi:homoserine O-acetyltransferase
MADRIPADSVGLVTPRLQTFDTPFTLLCGRVLPHMELVYETYGNLNSARSNAILICHALSGHHHAAGYHSADEDRPGWWDSCIGPGKPIDTNLFYVVSLNNLGGCNGSTGPRSINPETGRIYGPDFPMVTVRDWVATQAMLSDALGIQKWAAVVGGSLGGMQAMQWAIDLPERVGHALLIASASRLSAQNIAFNEIARQAIVTDPEFNGGSYLDNGTNPARGLMLARMLGHVTYQSDDGLRDKFGRDVKSGDLAAAGDVQFQVESYLHHQGRSFSQRFDANTYLLMTRALDHFDPARDFGDDLVAALQRAQSNFLVVSFTSDWRFAPSRSKEIVDALIAARKNVVSAVIDTPHGHDAFLLPVPRYFDVLRAYLAHAFAGLELRA